MSKETRDCKYIIIPIEIWEDETLTPFEKMLLAEIDSLDCGIGCYKSRRKMAERMVCTIGHVKNTIGSLRKRGWIISRTEKGTTYLRTRFSRHGRVMQKLPTGNAEVTPRVMQKLRPSKTTVENTTINEGRLRVPSNGFNFDVEEPPIKRYPISPKLVDLFFEHLVKIRHHLNRSDLPMSDSEASKKKRKRTFDQWLDAADLLMFQEGGKSSYIRQVIEWYFANRKNTKAYLPPCRSFTTFQENFDRIEVQMRRLTKQDDIGDSEIIHNENGVPRRRVNQGWVSAEPDAMI